MSEGKLTNLNYLNEVTGGEPMIVKEMLEMFIGQVPELQANIQQYLADKKYIELGKEAHKAKSSVLIVGMDDLGVRLKELQLLTEKGEAIEKYPEYVEEFVTKCDKAVEELTEALKEL
ncbi:Hpt domain-containing protein [Prolixibacteraceae bacterium JC049]|nr:Hpt domain-containing protein [Prolixibacteraceae bacterium JC049]